VWYVPRFWCRIVVHGGIDSFRPRLAARFLSV
jgi:hypothetical protein